MSPKIKMPLGSQSAKKSIGKILTFYDRGGLQKVRLYNKPSPIIEISLKQWTQRHIIGLLTAHWQVMTDDEKLIYEDLVNASCLKISGYNYFIKLAQADLYTHHGLCGYWSMNESTGNQVLDYSGQGNHGTLKPNYPANCPTRVSAMLKQYGNALSFDAYDDFVAVPHDESFNFDTTDNFTILGWFKLKPTASYPTPFDRGAGLRSLKGYRFEYNSSHFMAFFVCDGIVRDVVFSFLAIDDFVFHHIVGVYNKTAGQIYIYVDGIKRDTANITLTESMKVTRALYIGDHLTEGIIDEVRIYNRALSTAEIVKQYNLLR